ncbi:hypothetical protein E2C01_096486 [Portunus trituberculatus]|uniref:Uncharacterized protein n=1 Tax=Portunus trituberculatus TaxID=210409 RepID=A0A5B7K6Y7_PORTR|nr:hypothetical protein [Portunus trituberculatus]
MVMGLFEGFVMLEEGAKPQRRLGGKAGAGGGKKRENMRLREKWIRKEQEEEEEAQGNGAPSAQVKGEWWGERLEEERSHHQYRGRGRAVEG